MYLLYTDETNFDPESSVFFIYGGIAIKTDLAASLSEDISELRKKYGYRPGDPLKFNTRERPEHITPGEHKEIKREMMELATDYNLKLFTSFISHDIATSPEEARRKEINRICYHFNCFLNRVNDYGLVMIDNFNDDQIYNIIRDKFSIGLTGMPYSDEFPLERILGVHVACIGSSHFCSMVDIILGGLRFAVNSLGNEDKLPVARELLRQTEPLCIRTEYSGMVDEISVFFSPKTIKIIKYHKNYMQLYDFLSEGGINAEQVPECIWTY